VFFFIKKLTDLLKNSKAVNNNTLLAESLFSTTTDTNIMIPETKFIVLSHSEIIFWYPEMLLNTSRLLQM
jgi:hypothetical protein